MSEQRSNERVEIIDGRALVYLGDQPILLDLELYNALLGIEAGDSPSAVAVDSDSMPSESHSDHLIQGDFVPISESGSAETLVLNTIWSASESPRSDDNSLADRQDDLLPRRQLSDNLANESRAMMSVSAPAALVLHENRPLTITLSDSTVRSVDSIEEARRFARLLGLSTTSIRSDSGVRTDPVSVLSDEIQTNHSEVPTAVLRSDSSDERFFASVSCLEPAEFIRRLEQRFVARRTQNADGEADCPGTSQDFEEKNDDDEEDEEPVTKKPKLDE